jgi:hypothetical protein
MARAFDEDQELAVIRARRTCAATQTALLCAIATFVIVVVVEFVWAR